MVKLQNSPQIELYLEGGGGGGLLVFVPCMILSQTLHSVHVLVFCLRITKSLKCARRTYFSVAYLLMVSSIHNSGKYNKLDTYTNLGVQCSPWEHPSFGFFPQLL